MNDENLFNAVWATFVESLTISETVQHKLAQAIQDNEGNQDVEGSEDVVTNKFDVDCNTFASQLSQHMCENAKRHKDEIEQGYTITATA